MKDPYDNDLRVWILFPDRLARADFCFRSRELDSPLQEITR
jgi:hypothetical protein